MNTTDPIYYCSTCLGKSPNGGFLSLSYAECAFCSENVTVPSLPPLSRHLFFFFVFPSAKYEGNGRFSSVLYILVYRIFVYIALVNTYTRLRFLCFHTFFPRPPLDVITARCVVFRHPSSTVNFLSLPDSLMSFCLTLLLLGLKFCLFFSVFFSPQTYQGIFTGDFWDVRVDMCRGFGNSTYTDPSRRCFTHGSAVCIIRKAHYASDLQSLWTNPVFVYQIRRYSNICLSLVCNGIAYGIRVTKVDHIMTSNTKRSIFGEFKSSRAYGFKSFRCWLLFCFKQRMRGGVTQLQETSVRDL